jgi:hypothetical protein
LIDSNILAKLAPYLLPLLVLVFVARRLIRNTPRKVKPIRLFITPVILALAAAFTLNQTGVPSLLWMLVDVLAAAAGAGVGYLSARHREFTLDAETGEIMGRATPVGTIIFAALFAVRYGLKFAFPQLNGQMAYAPPGAYLHPAASAIGWADAGLVFSTGLLFATATTTWLRTRHLMAEQREHKRTAANGIEPPLANS